MLTRSTFVFGNNSTNEKFLYFYGWWSFRPLKKKVFSAPDFGGAETTKSDKGQNDQQGLLVVNKTQRLLEKVRFAKRLLANLTFSNRANGFLRLFRDCYLRALTWSLVRRYGRAASQVASARSEKLGLPNARWQT